MKGTNRFVGAILPQIPRPLAADILQTAYATPKQQTAIIVATWRRPARFNPQILVTYNGTQLSSTFQIHRIVHPRYKDTSGAM